MLKSYGYHTRNEEHEAGENLEEAGSDGAAACTCNDLGVVLAGLLSEHTLYDVLVSTPIPETDDGCSEEHHVTGIFRIHRVALISMEHVVDAVAVVHGAGIVHHC